MSQKKSIRRNVRKDDTTKNGDETQLEKLIRECRERDSKKVELKVDNHTTILVSKRNANRKYVDRWKERYGKC